MNVSCQSRVDMSSIDNHISELLAVPNAQLDELVVDNRISELLAVLNVRLTKLDLMEDALNAVSEIFSLLTDDAVVHQPEIVTACVELLNLLPYVCPVKELIISLFDQADCFKDDVKYKALLPPIQKSIQRLSSQKFHYVDMAAENLYVHLSSQPLPKDETDFAEALASGDSTTAGKLSSLVMRFLEFLKPFVEELTWCKTDAVELRRKSSQHIRYLTACIIRILEKPLGYLNLSSTEQKTSCCVCAEHCVQMIGLLQTNFVGLLESFLEQNASMSKIRKRKQPVEDDQLASANSDSESNSDSASYSLEEPVSEIGLGVLAYLVFDQHLYFSSFPQVFTSRHIFELNQHFVVTLLQTSHSQLIHKGLLLCSSLLNNISVKSLERQFLECERIQQLVQSLMQVILSSKIKELNVLAVRVFRRILKSFDNGGRMFLLGFVSDSFAQSNVQAFTVALVKDEIDECLRDDLCSKEYAVSLLKKFFSRFFTLAKSKQSNLIDEIDKILATLNLLRYLCIRDKASCNATGIWNFVPTIKKTYLETLRMDLSLMRAAVSDKIQKLKRGESMMPAAGSDTDIDVMISGQILEEMTPDKQLEAMQSAMTNMDLIESILARVEQLIEAESTAVVMPCL